MEGEKTGPAAEKPEERLRLAEETLEVSKRDVVTGKVRIATKVETFQETARANLQTTAVEVVRVSVDKPVEGSPPQVRTEGDVTIIPVLEEVLYVEKKLVLKEELHVRRRVEQEAVDMPVTLKRETAHVERIPSEDAK